MTTLATHDIRSEDEPIPRGMLGYFEARLSGLVHQAMLMLFARLERSKSFTRRDFARRIGRKPEQITRWFAYPGNLTLATVSDIFAGAGFELESIVLADLATGERLSFPEAPSAQNQILMQGGGSFFAGTGAAIVGLQAPAATPVRPVDRAARHAMDSAVSACFVPGKAEADQMELRGLAARCDTASQRCMT
jgi:hypothetical protein